MYAGCAGGFVEAFLAVKKELLQKHREWMIKYKPSRTLLCGHSLGMQHTVAVTLSVLEQLQWCYLETKFSSSLSLGHLLLGCDQRNSRPQDLFLC